MKILVIGGTAFLGRHLIEAALARQHTVTMFNRGKENPALYPTIEKVCGDRRENLDALKSGRWDAVIDTCGYRPCDVRASSKALADVVDHYTYISTVSVYADFSKPGISEADPAQSISGDDLKSAESIELKDPLVAANYGMAYGPMKALCEEAVEDAMQGRALTVRAGVIVGPYDYTDAFTYWAARVAQGEEVLAPGRPERQIQFIDARDISEWIIRMVEQRKAGVFNANGPEKPLTMQAMLEECKAVTGSDARFNWVDEGFLLNSGVIPWFDLPLWVPEMNPALKGVMAINSDKAIAAGLAYRPLDKTIRDVVSWNRARQNGHEMRAGLKREREVELLRSWRAAQG
jgi:nucleoside-diphosphate-sugar epimerase